MPASCRARGTVEEARILAHLGARGVVSSRYRPPRVLGIVVGGHGRHLVLEQLDLAAFAAAEVVAPGRVLGEVVEPVDAPPVAGLNRSSKGPAPVTVTVSPLHLGGAEREAGPYSSAPMSGRVRRPPSTSSPTCRLGLAERSAPFEVQRAERRVGDVEILGPGARVLEVGGEGRLAPQRDRLRGGVGRDVVGPHRGGRCSQLVVVDVAGIRDGVVDRDVVPHLRPRAGGPLPDPGLAVVDGVAEDVGEPVVDRDANAVRGPARCS